MASRQDAAHFGEGRKASDQGVPMLQTAIFDQPGSDTSGRKYDSLSQMWALELQEEEAEGEAKTEKAEPEQMQEQDRPHKKKRWYKAAEDYWKSVDASVGGMLGGFQQLDREDIIASKEFLSSLATAGMIKETAIDVGAGIGRITKKLLAPSFKTVDLLEQNPEFLKQARTELSSFSSVVRNYFSVGMQDFDFASNTYDCIWVQWVSGHLSDDDFVSFFQKCKAALRPGGFVVLKENNAAGGFIVDREDSSVTRTDDHIRALLQASGLTLRKVKLQPRFPKIESWAEGLYVGRSEWADMQGHIPFVLLRFTR